MKLELARGLIDELDEQLVRILSRRFSIIRKVKYAKKRSHVEVIDKRREKEILLRIRALAHTYVLSYPFLKKLFLLIIKESVAIQKEK